MDFNKQKSNFSKTLMEWYNPEDRPMPWKSETNPYLIWLSEIILQQTRVEQGLPYYNRFKNNYPTVKDLADAPEDEIMKLWEGLGYYSRAKNLHLSAKYIAYQLNNVFPENYKDILKLKGVGPYTASAIASFAFGKPCAVVDGNVYRILSRIFGIYDPIDTGIGKKRFEALSKELLDKENPAEYNQAILDFGAIQCKPKLPLCETCPFSNRCHAFQNHQIDLFPVKSKKIIRKTRYFNYLVLNNNNHVLIRKRAKNDIWKNLYEFPLIESNGLIPLEALFEDPDFYSFSGNNYKVVQFSKPIVQNLTHQKIISRFVELEVENIVFNKNESFKIIPRNELCNYAFSKNIDWYLKDNSLYLEIA